MRVGNGLDKAEIGPLVSEAARAKVIRLVEDAKAKGATVVCGGKIPDEPAGRLVLRADDPHRRARRIWRSCGRNVSDRSPPIVRVADFDEAIAPCQ